MFIFLVNVFANNGYQIILTVFWGIHTLLSFEAENPNDLQCRRSVPRGNYEIRYLANTLLTK